MFILNKIPIIYDSNSEVCIVGSINYGLVIEELKSEILVVIEREKICGLAIALVDKDRIVWSEGFGFTDITREEKITSDTLFSTQSMGKTITVTTFMILASKGLIALDDPIRKYYPEFNVNTKFGDKEKEIEKITFRRMLSHTAGFSHEAPIGNNNDDRPCTFEEHIASINGIWLRNKVGVEYAYANIGIDLTAYVLGRIQKKSFPEVVKEELFNPLGIQYATFDIKEAQKYSFARGHSGDFTTPAVQVPMLGAGGVYISVNEQAKFAIFHLNKGKINNNQLISLELFEEMYKAHLKNEGIDIHYNLGLYEESPINGQKVYAHGGGGYGYQTQQAWMPEYGISAIIFTNSMHHAGEQVKLARKALELMVKEKTKPKMVKITPEKLKRLQGTYYTYRRNIQNIVFEDGNLVLYNTLGGKEILYPQNEYEFLIQDNEKLVFKLDEQNEIQRMNYISKNDYVSFRYNDGPNDKPGPNEKSWEKHLGFYEVYLYGVKFYAYLGVFNGYLYICWEEWYRLNKHQENLFFTADGESLIIVDENKIILENVTLRKTKLDLENILLEMKTNESKRIASRRSLMLLSYTLNKIQGFEKAFDFIIKLIELDDRFCIILSKFGIRLYCFRELEKSKKCFEKLLALDKKDKDAEAMLRRINQELNQK
ncbi:MAG: class A beta-lactamase-related serine hydrolase [Candidatus Heimdallarchaeota archaeon]|nr:class A beta-lactamase-related serine hydrolase [Candidatus Heimdallarchaeota archaeon]